MTWLIKLALGLVALLVYSAVCVWGGYEVAQVRQAKQEAKQEVKAADNTQKLETANQVAAAPVIKEIEVIKWRVKEVVKEVPVVQTIEVPGACPEQPVVKCPAAVTAVDRLLIDAAAHNTDPPAGPGADAAPYPAGPLTASVVTNYGRCNVCISELRGLQDYVARTLADQRLLCPR
jgi:hypothetical protein